MSKKYVISFLLYLAASSPANSDVIEYFSPSFEGKRLDWCLTWGENCGKAVAEKWCITNGYSKPIYWEIEKHIGKETPTAMFDSKNTCNKNTCSGFRTIVCYREFQH